MPSPSYLKLHTSAELEKRAKACYMLLESCVICPRKCRVNRLKNERGFCRVGKLAKVFNYQPHHGEEPPISGTNGSGTIFFSSCNMHCVYCQNYTFSQQDQGKEVGEEELAQMMLTLQAKGCHNINLVTPTHQMPQILIALKIAADSGLKIPIVYNSSGYELSEVIKLLEGVVDIYLADLRYGDEPAGAKYSKAKDYPKYSQEALKEMQRQVGVAEIGADGMIKKGLIIRHLVLPNGLSGTEKIMRFISKELSPETYISLMSQFLPTYKAAEFKELNRRLTFKEYQEAKEIMEKYRLSNGWIQEAHGLEKLAGIHIKPNL